MRELVAPLGRLLPDLSDSALRAFATAARSFHSGRATPENLEQITSHTPLVSDGVGPVRVVLVAAPAPAGALTVGVVFLVEGLSGVETARIGIRSWSKAALRRPKHAWRAWGPLAHVGTTAWGRGSPTEKPDRCWVAMSGVAAHEVVRIKLLSSSTESSATVARGGAFLVVVDASWGEEPQLLGYDSRGRVVVKGP